MKAINRWLVLMVMLLAWDKTDAQINPLEKGAKVPDVDLGYVWNDPGKHYKFSDLKGKMVILDFWFTRCSGCVAGFPKMRALQTKFGDQVKIFLVTYESKEKVEAMIQKGYVDLSGMTVITGDSLLTKLFPPYSYPYHVWIDKEGVFRYGTFGFNTTEKNVRQFLAGENVSIGEVKFKMKNQKINSLLDLFGSYPQFIETYSILMKGQYEYFAEGTPGSFDVDSATSFPIRFQALGESPLSMLQSAFSEQLYKNRPTYFTRTDKRRIILEVRDKSILYQPGDENLIGNWRKENIWMYEVKVQPTTSTELYDKMILDLNQALPIFGVIEKRHVKHLALVRTDSVNRFISTGKRININDHEWTGKFIKFTAADISTVVFNMNLLNSGNPESLPVIDKTNINYKITFEMPIDTQDRLLFLKKNGFDLIECTDAIPMLVIKDKVKR